MGISFCCLAGEKEILLDEFGNQVEMKKKYVNKNPITKELKKLLKKDAPKDFLKLAKAKKVILTQEQVAALSMDKNSITNSIFDLTPIDFFKTLTEYLKKNTNALDGKKSLEDLVGLDAPGSLYGLVKCVSTVTATILGLSAFKTI